MQTAEDTFEWPEKLQFLFRPYRYKVAYGGRGGSKSWGVARALLLEGLAREIRVLCTRETQSSIQDSVHQLLSDQISSLGLDSHYTVKENEIVGLNGTLFKFAGLRQQDVTKIKSFENFSHCWVEEAQAVSDKSWSILIPTIRRPGSEIWVTFNPELDTDPTYERFILDPPQSTYVQFINWRDNPWFPDVLNQERLHLKRLQDEGKVVPGTYENVWEGQCRAAVDGAIFHNEIALAQTQGRIKDVPYDPDLPVQTIWDLGWNDKTSIIFVQKNRSEIAIIDYIEDDHRTLDSYVKEIESKPYRYNMDYLPHDGAAKSLQTGMSPRDIISRLGRSVDIIPQHKVEISITAARQIFSQCYFDKTRAKRLVHCLKRYRRSINTATNEPGAPLHDEYSHGADAFRMLGLVAREMSNNESMPPLKYDSRGIV
jgi:phage terminase large subunit